MVVDTSVVAKWFLIETNCAEASTVLLDGVRGDVGLHAPSYLLLELDSVLTKRVGGGFVAREMAERIRKEASRTPIRFHGIDSLREHAFALAVETRQSVYDCLFLALAISLNASMVTADLRFKKGLRFYNLRNHVIALTEYAPLLEK